MFYGFSHSKIIRVIMPLTESMKERLKKRGLLKDIEGEDFEYQCLQIKTGSFVNVPFAFVLLVE